MRKETGLNIQFSSRLGDRFTCVICFRSTRTACSESSACVAPPSGSQKRACQHELIFSLRAADRHEAKASRLSAMAESMAAASPCGN